MYDNYDFETTQEKEDYIDSNSVIYEKNGVNDEFFSCPSCDKEYDNIHDALTCCKMDCREQAEEMARDRNIYEATEQ